MNKFTKEQLQQIVETDHVQCGDAAAMARHLLAGLGQEPVYQACKESGVWVDIEPGDVASLKANGEQVRALYAAPQLPQPAVVVGRKAIADMVHGKCSRIPGATFYNAAELALDEVEACRAAMLQGEPVSQPDAIDANLVEALRLVQCMLEDYRERNYGDAEKWIRHINTHMSDYTESHGDDAYCVLHNLLPAAPQQEVTTDNTAQQFESLGLIVTSDERNMELPRCRKHPETELQAHPFEQLLSYPPQPVMYCPLCRPSVAKWVEFDKQLRQWKEVK